MTPDINSFLRVRSTDIATREEVGVADVLADAASGDGLVSKRNTTEGEKGVERLANNDATPEYAQMQKERPRHRMMVELAATGRFTNKEIAEALECTSATVNYALRQPWARELLVKLMRDSGNSEREKAFSLLEGLTIKAVQRQEEILALDICKETVEPIRKVSNDILNRAYGTPTATVKTISSNDDLDNLTDAEIAQRLAELKDRRAGN